MSEQSGKSERCVHSERYGTERAAYGTEQNCNSADEGSGSGGRQEAVEVGSRRGNNVRENSKRNKTEIL